MRNRGNIEKTGTPISKYSEQYLRGILRYQVYSSKKSRSIDKKQIDEYNSFIISKVTDMITKRLSNTLDVMSNLSDVRDIKEYIKNSTEDSIYEINRIREISDISSKKLFVTPRPVFVEDVFSKSIEKLKKNGALKSDSLIQKDIDGDVQFILGDMEMLVRIFSILLYAATDLPNGSLPTTFSAKQANDLFIHFTISNPSQNITPREIRSLEKPLGLVEMLTRNTHDQMCLFLPIARGLIDLHGGFFKIMSTLKSGIRIEVKLPVHNKGTVCRLPDRRQSQENRPEKVS